MMVTLGLLTNETPPPYQMPRLPTRIATTYSGPVASSAASRTFPLLTSSIGLTDQEAQQMGPNKSPPKPRNSRVRVTGPVECPVEPVLATPTPNCDASVEPPIVIPFGSVDIDGITLKAFDSLDELQVSLPSLFALWVHAILAVSFQFPRALVYGVEWPH